MNKNKLRIWMIGIPILVIVLVAIILLNETDSGQITRASAYKAIALAKTTKDECERQSQSNSSFSITDQNEWYAKYMDYLYAEGILDKEQVPPTKEESIKWLSYKDVVDLANQLAPELVSIMDMKKSDEDSPFPLSDWNHFYSSLLKVIDPDANVQKVELSLYGTPLNVEGAPAWKAYTSEGDLSFEGLPMDDYIDNRLSVLLRGKEIIQVVSIIDHNVVYENVWITQEGDTQFRAYVGSIERIFPLSDSLGDPSQFLDQVADLYLQDGELKKLVLKKERITAKVLSIKEDSIELEGYGNLELDPNFQVYKIYGDFRRQKRSEILVGYDNQEFVLARGKVSAALSVRPFDAKNIRVLLMDTGFHSIFHPSVTISSDSDMQLLYNEEVEIIKAGEMVELFPEDERFHQERIIIQLANEESNITIHSIERAQSVSPSYGGHLEILKEPEGFVIINDLYLEDYLTKVVPSEMGSSYEKEALKAQAVCARTYAYRQIRSNTYREYGAHVDDSTRFQVYNNIGSDEKTQAAVRETYGKMIFYNQQPIEAFYFSTSPGHTTDGSVWGADPTNFPYLSGVEVKPSKGALDLSSNKDFSEFIKDKKASSYEALYPLYRWNVTITSQQLEEKIQGIGKIERMKVTQRGEGGIVKTLLVEGSEGTKEISGQGQVRSMLGNKNVVIKKNDGKELTGWDTIPSAFISIDPLATDENGVTTFRIYGGGYGHGVGMSQNGAQAMAKAGMDYEEILQFFYKDIEIKEVEEGFE